MGRNKEKLMEIKKDDSKIECISADLAELKEVLLSIEELIAFAKSENAVKYFGEDDAREMLKHAEERKAAGEKFCDCEACAAAAAIIDKVETN